MDCPLSRGMFGHDPFEAEQVAYRLAEAAADLTGSRSAAAAELPRIEPRL